MDRFIALRELKESARVYSPGDFVPGVEKWGRGIIQANVNVGNIYDLHREYRLKEASFAAHQRERALLDDIHRLRSMALADDPDHKGRKLFITTVFTQRAELPEAAPSTPLDHQSAKKTKKPKAQKLPSSLRRA